MQVRADVVAKETEEYEWGSPSREIVVDNNTKSGHPLVTWETSNNMTFTNCGVV